MKSLHWSRPSEITGLKAARTVLSARDEAATDYFDAVRYAGAAWGWLRFRAGQGARRAGRQRAAVMHASRA